MRDSMTIANFPIDLKDLIDEAGVLHQFEISFQNGEMVDFYVDGADFNKIVEDLVDSYDEAIFQDIEGNYGPQFFFNLQGNEIDVLEIVGIAAKRH